MSVLVHIVFERLMIRYGVFALQKKRETHGVVFAGTVSFETQNGDRTSYIHTYNLSIIGPDTNYIVVIVHSRRVNARPVNVFGREDNHGLFAYNWPCTRLSRNPWPY